MSESIPRQAASVPPPEAPRVEKDPGQPRSRESIWALRRPLPRSWQLPLAMALPGICLILWVALTSGSRPIVGPLFLPAPQEVLRVLIRDVFTGDRVILQGAIASMMRIAVSFAVAAAVALPLGVLMGAFEPINRVVDPVMAPMRYMPISAFIPLTILWFGIYEKQKIAFLFLGVFVYLLPVVITAIRAVPEELVQTAMTLGAGRGQVIWTVLLPAALPDIFDSFRVMNAIAWTYVILAEFVNAGQGLGSFIQIAGNHLKTAEVFAGIGVIGVIGLCTDALIGGLLRLLFPWRETSHG